MTTGLVVLSCGIGLVGVGGFWSTGSSPGVIFPSSGPTGTIRAHLDGLTALFLVPVYLVTLLGSIYGLGYWPQAEHPANGRKLGLFYGVLAAGMAILLVAADGFLFLVGWEVMALAAYFLVTTEDHSKEPREAGWVYFVAAHLRHCAVRICSPCSSPRPALSTLTPIAPDQITPTMSTAMFVLVLVGFGLKAGVMPLHVWLPGAHAAAPSHVSALMSGVIIKMGIYGLVRFTAILPHQRPGVGGAPARPGAVSGVLGVAFALGQHDLKRLLAYHSIENIGIIVMGLGLAAARPVARPAGLGRAGMAGPSCTSGITPSSRRCCF